MDHQKDHQFSSFIIPYLLSVRRHIHMVLGTKLFDSAFLIQNRPSKWPPAFYFPSESILQYYTYGRFLPATTFICSYECLKWVFGDALISRQVSQLEQQDNLFFERKSWHPKFVASELFVVYIISTLLNKKIVPSSIFLI